MRYGVICGCCLEHTDKSSRLCCCQLFGRYVEIGFASSLNTVCRGSKIHGVGIHAENGVLIVAHFQLCGNNPFFGFHDEHTYARDFSEQASGIFCTYPKKVFSQLLGDGRRTTAITFGNGILSGSKHSDGVYTPVAVKALVFGVDKCIPKYRVNVAVVNWRAVLIEILANEFSVGTIYFGCLRRYGVVDSGPSWRLAEEPKEVDVYHTEVDKESYKHRNNGHASFEIPLAANV